MNEILQSLAFGDNRVITTDQVTAIKLAEWKPVMSTMDELPTITIAFGSCLTSLLLTPG